MQESEKWKWHRSVVSNSSRPHGLQPTRLLRPWNFPGKSTGVGCHCLLHQGIYRNILLNSFFINHSFTAKSRNFHKNLIFITKNQVIAFSVAQSCPTLVTSWIAACQAPLSVPFPRHLRLQGNLPDPDTDQIRVYSVSCIGRQSLPRSHRRRTIKLLKNRYMLWALLA